MEPPACTQLHSVASTGYCLALWQSDFADTSLEPTFHQASSPDLLYWSSQRYRLVLFLYLALAYLFFLGSLGTGEWASRGGFEF